jgi:hypothetical protein
MVTTNAAPAEAGAPEGASASTPASSGSFIQNALSELSKAAQGEPSSGDISPSPTGDAPSPSSAKETSEIVKGPSPEEPKEAAPEGSKGTPNEPDEEDAKAEADIKRETANMPPSQRAAFTKLRYEARDLKRQLKAAAEEKANANVNAVTPTENTEANAELERLRGEYESMKTKMGEYEKEAFVTRLEATDVYQNEVVRPRENVAANISEIARRYSDVDQESVVAAVRTGDPERVSRVTADMSEFDRYKFYNLVEQYQAINSKESNLRENSKESLENIYRAQREQREAKASEEKTQWEKSVGDVWKQLEEDFPVLAPVEGDEDWNGKLEKVKSFATPDRFDKLTIRERAEALHRAAAFPVLVSELEMALDEMKSMQAKLSKYEGATPGVSSERGGSEGGYSPSSSAGFVENALSELRKMGVS